MWIKLKVKKNIKSANGTSTQVCSWAQQSYEEIDVEVKDLELFFLLCICDLHKT